MTQDKLSICLECRSCFAKSLTITSFVVLTWVEVVNSFALCLLSVYVDVLLTSFLVEEWRTHLLWWNIHSLEETGSSIGKFTKCSSLSFITLFILLLFFILIIHIDQLSPQTAILWSCSLFLINIHRLERRRFSIKNHHFWK